MPKRLTAVQKKKRLEQLREAQRRRRSRLKEGSKKFVQIILPEPVLNKLRRLAKESGQTIQALIAHMVEQSVGLSGAVPAKLVETGSESVPTTREEIAPESASEAKIPIAASNGGEPLDGPDENLEIVKESESAFQDPEVKPELEIEASAAPEAESAGIPAEIEREEVASKKEPGVETAQLDLF